MLLHKNAIHHFIYFPTPLYTKTRCQAGFCVSMRILPKKDCRVCGSLFSDNSLCVSTIFLEQAQDHGPHHAAHGQRHAVQQRVVHHGEDEDAAVGRTQGAAEGHG